MMRGTVRPIGRTIDEPVTATGLGTRSCYHHFSDMPGYKTALLANFEEIHTTEYPREIEAADLDPHDRLDLLIDLVLEDDEPASIEVAVRAWALDDPIAAAAEAVLS
ncbi:hypothetical protein [Nocardia sp. NPDC052112]|uniref:hypothetical protein n=1 Tax=Nocardia sp. NPDC052112 TaxID=3155646 RepID=UPI003427636A